jgi:hypothetical protein
MTQYERTTNAQPEGATKIGVYDRPERTAPYADDRHGAIRPTDLIRWGPIFGGLFAALATLITLSVLGLAIGLSVFETNDPLGNIGLGAGIWGAVTALIAFFVGGWVASRTAAFSGPTSGILTGAMVWFVAIPLLIYLIGGGIGALTGTALQAASIPGALDLPITPDPAVPAPGTAPEGAEGAQPALPTTEEAAERAAQTAWSILLSLGLAALASILGGFAGARSRNDIAVRVQA